MTRREAIRCGALGVGALLMGPAFSPLAPADEASADADSLTSDTAGAVDARGAVAEGGAAPAASVLAPAWPIHFEGLTLELSQDVALTQVEVPEQCQTLDELVFGVDAALFNSVGAAEEQTTFFSLGEELLEEARAGAEAFVAKVLQASLLGHNFHHTYNDAHLDEGLLGFGARIADDYATQTTDEEPNLPVVHYEFYRNSLQPQRRDLDLADLPLYRDAQAQGRAWLAVENSEQLVFAVQYGYVPWCVPGSDAAAILARCVEALGWITDDGMTQTETYRAIYQYVLTTTRYDYTTLLDIYQRTPQNRVFFLEGAVLDGCAVCDGMCKELVLLARLMGIEAWHVGALGDGSGHAYVYVQVDGNWYLSCPTYGSNRYTRKDGQRQDYHTNNFLLTNFQTNMEGWPYDADVLEGVEEQLRAQRAYDYWSAATVAVDGRDCNLHPQTVDDAMAVLMDALDLQRGLGMPVEVELCGSVRVLRDAYARLKEACDDVVYLSGGTFEGQRLQIYLIGAQA